MTKLPTAMILAFICLVAVVLFVPLPIRGRIMTSISDLLHAPLFALISACVFGFARNRISCPAINTMLICWALVVGFGVVTELLQPVFGRDASAQDIWANTCGASAGILWTYASSMRPQGLRKVLVLVGCLVILFAVAKPILTLTDTVIQRLEMPRIASFERAGELSRWSWQECNVKRIREHATHGSWALCVDLETGKSPLVSLDHPVVDWSQFQKLVIDVRLSNGPPLNLIVRIEDIFVGDEYPDEFHQITRLSPGENRLDVALSDVAAGQIDLHRVWFLQLITDSPTSPRTLYFDNIRLE